MVGGVPIDWPAFPSSTCVVSASSAFVTAVLLSKLNAFFFLLDLLLHLFQSMLLAQNRPIGAELSSVGSVLGTRTYRAGRGPTLSCRVLGADILLTAELCCAEAGGLR